MSIKLSPEQKDYAKAWIDDKVTLIGACPICSHRDWSIGDHLVQMVTYAGPNTLFGGNTVPMVTLVCNHCANVQFQGAIHMGVIKRDGTFAELPS